VYGIGKHRSLADWRDLARALLHQGLIAESGDGYSVLTLNTHSWEVLRGTRQVQIAASVTAKSQAAPVAVPEIPVDAELFDALRTLRKRLATENGVPPYVIFHDATLRMMAQRRPATHDEFLTIPGVGRTKLDRYADRFIAAITQHDSR
jgi:ATP-dependent DNA helicase RecQ